MKFSTPPSILFPFGPKIRSGDPLAEVFLSFPRS